MKVQQTGRYVTTTVAGESVDAFVPNRGKFFDHEEKRDRVT